MSNTFQQLNTLIGQNIKVNLGGPESRSGILISIKSDYLIVQTKKEGILYYPFQHIKGIQTSPSTKSDTIIESDFFDHDDFEEVLEQLKLRKVKINRGGPDSVEGIITGLTNGNIILSKNDEILFIPIFHVKNINEVILDEEKEEDEENNENETNEEELSEDEFGEEEFEDQTAYITARILKEPRHFGTIQRFQRKL